MTNEIVKKSFVFNGTQIRTAIIDGDPWFVAKDVCEVLEISNARDAVDTLEADEKDGVGNADASGREQGAISEPDFRLAEYANAIDRLNFEPISYKDSYGRALLTGSKLSRLSTRMPKAKSARNTLWILMV